MKSKDNAGYLVALTLLLAFGLLVLWEFWLERFILVNYLEFEIHKTSLDRWTFIVSCLSIVCISLILPLKNMKNTSNEMKSLRTALHGEQALSRVFLSVDNSIILIMDQSNKIMQINKKTSFLLGFKEDEMLGQDWISLLIEEKNRADLKTRYQQFVKDKNQNFTRFTAAVKAKDGSEKMIDWQCAPLRDENGKIYGSINSGQDVSEQIRLRGEFSQIKGKLEPQIKKLTTELNFNKKKYHSEAIKSANARSRFRFWFELESTLMHLSPEQIKDPEEIKNRIQKALKLFGEISNVDHGYIFKFTQSGSHIVNTHLWVAGEPMLESDNEEEVSLDDFPWFKNSIQKKGIIHIPKIEEMPEEASSEKEVYLSQGIKSLISAPIIHNDSAVGYIGFESSEREKKWDDDEINIIQVIARLISSITDLSSPSDAPSEEEAALSLEENAEVGHEMDIPELSLEKTPDTPQATEIPTQETAPSIDKELRNVRESFEIEFQEKIKSMEQAQAQLTSELNESKKIEADLRSSQDSIKHQLEEKSLELEKFQAKGNPDAEDSLKKEIEVLETANRVMEAELEELRKVQEEFFTHSIQLEDTQQELESLQIANEQLMTDIEEKNHRISEAKEKATHYEQMDLPLFTLDQDGNILTWNKKAAAVTGYIPELALGSPISFMFADKDDFDFETEFLLPLREKFKYRLEVSIKKPNGDAFNSLISLASFKDRNGIVSTLGYLINLSETGNEDEVNHVKKQFSTLLGNSGLILVTLSNDFFISDANEKAESTFQWNPENTLGKNFFEIILPEESWQEVSTDIQKRIDTQSSVDLETQMMKDGTEHTFLWNLVKEIDPRDESVKGVIAIAQDVTDMRSTQNNMNRVQEELQENQLLLNLLVDKTEDGLISIDENGIIQSFNAGAEKLFGFTPHEIIGQNVNQLMPDPYSKEHDNYIKNYLEAGISSFVDGPPKELIGKNKNGSTFPIEITLKEIYKDYQRLFIGIVRDIRKRKEIEIQLAGNKEKYTRFMNAESNAILIVDNDSQQILECNPAAPQLYGYGMEEFINLNFNDLVAETDRSSSGDSQLPVTELSSLHQVPQIHLVKKDGTTFPASISSSSFQFKDIEYELKIIRDISAEVQLEKSLKENQHYLEKLGEQSEKHKIALREEKSNMVEHITSSMVDLVNNPIQGIENILGQVKEQAEMADIHKGLVTVAMNECRRVAELINRLKSFQPPTKENLESLNVHQVLDEIIQNNRDAINDRTITLEKHYANDIPTIDGVTPQIRQAINNIVKNAEESLSDEEGKIIISTEQDGSNVKIHIQDTGCGIAETDINRIFDPFFTTKSTTHRPGLGLLASLGIVKNHNGEIDVHSQPGEGTTFTVILPLKQPLNQNGESNLHF